MTDNDTLGKRILLETIDYLRYKVANDRLTMQEVDCIARLISERLELSGTAEDFARFYGTSVDRVRHVLHRRVFDEPLRQVLHSFKKFSRAVPYSWKDAREGKHK